ncbi:MAG: hypothetical protein GXP29_09045 [Planctomycetes bacterium]|nr:hypothetical protein [Planctomycetota bacterium]
MADAGQQVVRCQCGAKLRVPAAAAGRKVKCPKCGFKILIDAPTGGSSAPSVPSPPPSPPVSVPQDDDNLLDDLMSAESTAETTVSADLSTSQKNCPKCRAAMKQDATTCFACGFDPATIPKAATGAGAASKVGKLAAGTGRFGIGCALSAVGALIGAGIWYGVAVNTGVEWGYIAWGVGVFAGLGMKFGYGQENLRGALAAVTMAALGIVAVKGMISSEYEVEFIELFGIIDAVFIFLALSSAFKIGGGIEE